MNEHFITKYGEITIKDIPSDIVKELQEIMPYGFFDFKKEVEGSKYGFIVKCEDMEVPCLKLQPADVPKSMAPKLLNLHHCLILDAYVKFIKRGFNCIYYATPYFKEKQDNQIETGIAHYIFPNGCISKNKVKAYDTWMGDGCTGLFVDFMEDYKSNFSDNFRIPYIGIDRRYRSQLGGLISGFMLYNTSVIFMGTTLYENDPRLNVLAKGGIKLIYHAPSLPMVINQKQIPISKGQV